jgi:hypothetical protein
MGGNRWPWPRGRKPGAGGGTPWYHEDKWKRGMTLPVGFR